MSRLAPYINTFYAKIFWFSCSYNYLCSPIFNNTAFIIKEMRKDTHPKNYRLVVFKDMSDNTTFITRSTASSKETIKMEDGQDYPLIKLEISASSHPFYTGKMKLVDTAGRVDKFMNRYKNHLDKKNKANT